MMINPGENHQGKITGNQERVYIPRQSSLVMQASRVVLGLACSARAVECPEEGSHSWTIVPSIITIPFTEALASLSQVDLTSLFLFLRANKEMSDYLIVSVSVAQ